MFGKKQKGFTIIELLVSLWALVVFAFGLFVITCIVYAAGKFLFGWWG